MLNALYLNSRLKHVMFDSVPKSKRKALMWRCLIQLVTISVNYTALKYFPLTTVAVFSNMAPLIVVVLGRLFFGESIEKEQLFMLLVAFIAIQCMVFGAETNEKDG